MKLGVRYDLRSPSFGAAFADLYPAAIEQCAWADRLGFETVSLAEHHGADDGYCASPMVVASGIAARTTRLRINLSALVGVLHHPLRLAEDLATLDLISEGRIAMTLGMGYRPHEYEMFGIEKSRRGPLLEEIVSVLDQAWTGEPFEFHGTTVMVRPTPVQKPRPPIYIGGSTEASAIRAARFGDNYFPALPHLTEIYEAERQRLGLEVPPRPDRGPAGPFFIYVTEDPERDWELVGPHVLYATNMTAEWAKERVVNGQIVGATPYPEMQDIDALKASERFFVGTPEDCVRLARSLGQNATLNLHPLMGGLHPDIAWHSLELFEGKVLPALVELGYR